MTESEERAAFEAWTQSAKWPLESLRASSLIAGDYSNEIVSFMWKAWQAARASSPPVPQQGAEADAFNRKLRRQLEQEWADLQRLKAAQLPPLEAGLRAVKTNQEIDAMVREMKQPSDEQIDGLIAEYLDPVATYPKIKVFARAVLALHAEPVEKMKGEGADASPPHQPAVQMKDAVGILAQVEEALDKVEAPIRDDASGHWYSIPERVVLLAARLSSTPSQEKAAVNKEGK